MIPAFAVVGHPNKGKSSVVSTLARDDSIVISQRSGTTTAAKTYEVVLQNLSYQLIDTPGFQRPRKVLAWLQSEKVSADKRAQRVEDFLKDSDCQQQYPDEYALLAPIMQGAAILYVVDASRPYSEDYEAEMEILRWTGQPSMALINPINNTQYLESWQQALGQYFSLVRVFNAVRADLNQHIQLLEAFTLLHLPWANQLNLIIDAFKEQRETQKKQSCAIVTQLLEDLCGYQLHQKVLNKQQADHLKPLLNRQYYQWMRQREARAHDQLQHLYRHELLQREQSALALDDDLFDTQKWFAWGLSKSQLTKVAAIAGASAGGAIDLAVAGHSFFLGAITGGLLGSATAWLSGDKLADIKLKGLPLGGYEARQGPMRNSNFPYVVLARFLFVYRALQGRNHAQRENLLLEDQQVAQLIEQLQSAQRRKLYKALDKLSRQKSSPDLVDVLLPLFVIEESHESE